MPKMFSANPRVSRTDNSKISSSSNNKMITRSTRLSQLAKSSKYSVNKTLASTFGPTDIFLSSYKLVVNSPIGTEIARISSKDVNSFSFVYTIDDTSLFYIEGDKLYTNTVFPTTSIDDSLSVRISTSDGTYRFSKNIVIPFPKPPVVNILPPIVINPGTSSNTFNLSNTFVDVYGISTITAISDNLDLVTATVDGYELTTTYNNISGSAMITLIAYNTANVFAVTRFSIVILPNDVGYNVIVNELPSSLPEPIDIIIDGVPISYTQLDSTYVNIVIDDTDNATEQEKRDNVKSNISAIITNYNVTSINDTELDLYIPIDALPFPQLASNIDNVRIIDGSTSTSENPFSVNLTDNLENSAMYVNTIPGNKVIVNLENDILIIEQMTKDTFNVSINSGEVETKNAGDFVTAPTSEMVITLSSIIIAENHAPIAYDINTIVEFNAINSLIELNGYDVDIDETSSSYIQYVIETLPQYGVLDVLQNTDLISNNIKYTPVNGYLGVDTFSYYVKDNYGLTSNIATANINVNFTSGSDNGTLTITGTEIYEGYEIGHEIGTLTIPDTDTTNFTYTVDSNLFSINNDKLVSNHVFSYGSNNMYPITITSSDETSIRDTTSFVITIKRLWVYTIISSTEVAIGNDTAELANGTVLGTNLTGSIIIPPTINDIDGNTYDIINIYQNAFTGSSIEKIIFSGNNITYNFNERLKQFFRITQTNDPYILHQSYAPVIVNNIQLSGTEIYEGYEIGHEIGTLTIPDTDTTNFTYTVDSNLFSINNDKLVSNHVFSYGSNNTYPITITVNEYTIQFVITIKRLWVYTIISSTEVAIGNDTTDIANGTVLGTNLTGSIIIPPTIDDVNGNTYNVTNVYQNAFTGSGVEKIQFAGDSIYTLDIPLKEVFHTDEEDILHQLNEL